MGFWEIVLIVACVAIVGGVVLARVLRKKNSSDGCGGSCGCCPYCSSCSSHADDDTATHD